MLIFWGTKLVRKRMGFVADFCPICRSSQAFQLNRVGAVRHVYFLSFGSGKLLGHEIICQECKIALEADPLKYASISKKVLPANELYELTFPNIREVYKERLAFEEKLARKLEPLTAEERRKQIFLPFALLSAKVEDRLSATRIDKESFITLVGVIVFAVVAINISNHFFPESQPQVILSAIVIGLVAFIGQLALSGRRFMRKQIVPIIAKSLLPIQPTDDELKAAIMEFKRAGHKIGKKLKPADLTSKMQPAQGYTPTS